MLRSVKYGICGAALAGLVGGTVAFTSTSPDKTVRLVVDGVARSVHTDGSRVSDVLAGAGLHAGAHDLLAPSASSPVADGATIVLKRGRLLHVDLDGADRTVWTTASTVSQAMSDLGLRSSDFTSVSRSRRLPLSPTDLTVRTPKYVTVSHDGTRTSVTTTAATVAALFDELDLGVDKDDRVSVPRGSALRTGETILVRRIMHTTSTRTTPIPFATKDVDDPDLLAGTTKVVQAGSPGARKLQYSLVYVDGTLAGRTLLSATVLRDPVTAIRHIGVQQGTPEANMAIARSLLGNYGFGQDQFSCLEQMWYRESHWTVDAANPSGAYGIPQALPGDKMATVGADWQTNAETQIKWGLGYIKDRYGTPCDAWAFWQGHNYY